MILDKETRRRIYVAEGKPVNILWPADAPELKVGTKYTIQSSAKRAGEGSLRVEAKWEEADGQHATVCLDVDEVRLLGRAGGYSSSADGAIKVFEHSPDGQFQPEPEAVDADYQRRLVEEGRIRTALRGGILRARREAWMAEDDLARQLRKGKPGTLARAAAERAQRRVAEAEAEEAE